jgi:hypothetical protein
MNTILDDPDENLAARIFHLLCIVANVDVHKFGTCCMGCTERIVSMHNIAKYAAADIQQVMRETVHRDGEKAPFAKCMKDGGE